MIKQKNGSGKKVDFTFLIIVLMLLIYGLTMVFSASSASAHYQNNDAFYFIKRQLIFALLGLGAMWFIATKMSIKTIQKWSVPILGITFVLLILVLIPGIGIESKGARRWLGIERLFTFQPSEITKYAIILFTANSLSKRQTKLERFWKDLMPYLGVIVLFSGLILLEDHLSGATVVAFSGCLVLFLYGAKISHFVWLGGVGVSAIAAAAIFEPYRLKRLVTFVNPFADPLGDGFQIIQSLYAIGSGGFFGLGLGQSRQKYMYIPEPHNDFIFSIICEELGFFGALLVIVLFALLIWRGIKIAMAAPDMFSALSVGGIIGLVAFQVIVNIAVVTSSMPVTGMALPFFSYGGSSLTFLLAAMGYVLNVSKNMNKKQEG